MTKGLKNAVKRQLRVSIRRAEWEAKHSVDPERAKRFWRDAQARKAELVDLG